MLFFVWGHFWRDSFDAQTNVIIRFQMEFLWLRFDLCHFFMSAIVVASPRICVWSHNTRIKLAGRRQEPKIEPINSNRKWLKRAHSYSQRPGPINKCEISSSRDLCQKKKNVQIKSKDIRHRRSVGSLWWPWQRITPNEFRARFRKAYRKSKYEIKFRRSTTKLQREKKHMKMLDGWILYANTEYFIIYSWTLHLLISLFLALNI